MINKDEKEEIIFDASFAENRKKKKRGKKILDELDELEKIENSSSFVSVSSYMSKREKKEKEKKDKDKEIQDDWLQMINSFEDEPIQSRKAAKGIFEPYYAENGKKKKKKKKKEGELTDYNKEFETDAKLIRNLLVEQTKFTDALQRRYNAMAETKSSARGVGKFTTDLIAAVNQARTLSMQLVEKQVNLKKTIADLTMKEKKEFGKTNDGAEDMGLYSSRFLKEMINERGMINSMDGYDVPTDDADISDLFNAITENIGDDQNSDEVDKYLEYERSNVTIYACVNDNDDAYFEARDENDNVIPDYPLPEMTKLNINRSTNVASDKYSTKYPIIYV